LLRALLNALDNALDAADSRVTITAARAGERLDVSVIDHGAGLSEEDRARVLEPLGSRDDRARPDHAGLGLAVAHGLVEAAGGRLTLEETHGGGLTLVMSLPLGEPVAPRHRVAQR
jgi:two-component system sensor histidine kinase KdpD